MRIINLPVSLKAHVISLYFLDKKFIIFLTNILTQYAKFKALANWVKLEMQSNSNDKKLLAEGRYDFE